MGKKGKVNVVEVEFGHPNHEMDDLSVDKILVRAVKKGDSAAFEILLKRYQKAIHRFAFRFLGDYEAANDVAQETFLRFYASLQRNSEIKFLSALLFKIAKNCCIDIKRKQHLHSIKNDEMPVDNRTALHILDDKERRIKIESLVRSLPENQQIVILLRHSESLSYQDIADVMSISVSAVESLLFRARSKLRELLTGEDLQISTQGN